MSMIGACDSKTPSTESGSGGSDPYLQKCGMSSASASSPDDSPCMDSTTVTAVNRPVVSGKKKSITKQSTTQLSDSELADSSDNDDDSDTDSSGSDAAVVDDCDDNALTKDAPSSSSKPGHRR